MIYPSLEVSSNFKEFFILYDALQNAGEGVNVLPHDTTIDAPFANAFDTVRNTDSEEYHRTYTVLNQALWYTDGGLYFEHPSIPKAEQICNAEDFSTFFELTYRLLTVKQRCYEVFVNELTSGCLTLDRMTLKHLDYFRFVVQQVEVNKHYTFVPNIVLKPNARLYSALRQEGFAETGVGLIKKGTLSVVPIINFTGTPRQKLSHIPIRCARREKT